MGLTMRMSQSQETGGWRPASCFLGTVLACWILRYHWVGEETPGMPESEFPASPAG